MKVKLKTLPDSSIKEVGKWEGYSNGPIVDVALKVDILIPMGLFVCLSCFLHFEVNHTPFQISLPHTASYFYVPRLKV